MSDDRHLDDAQLDAWARAHRDGDVEGFRLLVEALTRGLIALAYRYVGDWETARDLTQETWLRAHRSIQRWDPTRPVRPWLSAIHRNGCLDHLRRTTNTSAAEAGELDRIEDPRSDPFADAARAQLTRRVRAALDQLSAAQRQVLVMVDLEELRPAEVAAQTGMNPGTVRTTLHFARRKLARLLGSEES